METTDIRLVIQIVGVMIGVSLGAWLATRKKPRD